MPNLTQEFLAKYFGKTEGQSESGTQQIIDGVAYQPYYAGDWTGAGIEQGGYFSPTTLRHLVAADAGEWYPGKRATVYNPDGSVMQSFEVEDPNKADAGEKLAKAFIAMGVGMAGAGLAGFGPAAAGGGAGAGGAGSAAGFVGEGAMSGIPGWDAAFTGAQGAGVGGAGSAAGFIGEGVPSGVPGWDQAAGRAGVFDSTTGAWTSAAADSQLHNATLPMEEALAGYRAPGATPGSVSIGGTTYSGGLPNPGAPSGTPPAGASPGNSMMDKISSFLTSPAGLATLLTGVAGASGSGSGGGAGGGAKGYAGGIPSMTAMRDQYAVDPNRRPGSAPQRYLSDVKYMAGGGIASLGQHSDGGRLLRGPGDGVSDDIPATIEGTTPAALADGEFVVPARIVSELGNGSTEAGARKLYAMMDRIQKARRSAKDIAADTKAARHLPA